MATRVWPTAMASAGAGAYAYNSAQNSSYTDIVRGFAGNLGLPSSSPAAPSGSSGAGLTALQSEVERLQQLLSDVVRGQRSGPHIIYRDSRGYSWVLYLVPVAGATYVYFRLRGWAFGDFMYVTRGSLTNLRSTVTDNFTRIWDYMGKQKEEFLTRFTALGQQQTQLIDAQGQMDNRLRDVGADVTGIASTAERIGEQVTALDGRMALVDNGVQFANQGIMLLCQAMADVTHRLNFNGNSANALRSYAQAVPMLQGQGVSPSMSGGLRGLLGAGVSPLSLISAPDPAASAASATFLPSASFSAPPRHALNSRLPSHSVSAANLDATGSAATQSSPAADGLITGESFSGYGPPNFGSETWRNRSLSGVGPSGSVLFQRNMSISQHPLPGAWGGQPVAL